MQFTSYFFVLLFAPLAVVGYFLCNKISQKIGMLFLIAFSFWFYAMNGIEEIVLICLSLLINYGISKILLQLKNTCSKKTLLCIGILANCLVLFYFKYMNFFAGSIYSFLGKEHTLADIALPLGISFYTFQQVAYLVDSYRNETEGNSFLEYLLYVLYFPKILMGPIAMQDELIPQFRDESKKKANFQNISSGIQMFSFGLFKKIMLAETFGQVVDWGFANSSSASSIDLILIMLSYTFQIYFDFSGYCDMAIGVSRMLNIDLPINFDSPYQALSINEFWKRWHISLTKFLTKYIYIPLGGNRNGKLRTYVNVLIVFLISGIWHGANWTFILWGFLHGAFSVFDKLTKTWQERIHPALRWIFTFIVVNVLWLLFRASGIREWVGILRHICRFDSMNISDDLINHFSNSFEITKASEFFSINILVAQIRGFYPLLFICVSLLICLVPKNCYKRKYVNNIFTAFLTAFLICWCMLHFGSESVFVYNNF